MVATSRDELQAVTEREWDKLAILLDDVDPGFAMQKDEDGVSIKDVIGHRAHWLKLLLGWHEDGVAGREIVYPAPGYNGNETHRYNADLRAKQDHLGWSDVRSMLEDSHWQLIGLVADCPDLYDGPMVAPHKWTTGRWAEANGSSHYRSAAKYIRSRKRNG